MILEGVRDPKEHTPFAIKGSAGWEFLDDLKTASAGHSNGEASEQLLLAY